MSKKDNTKKPKKAPVKVLHPYEQEIINAKKFIERIRNGKLTKEDNQYLSSAPSTCSNAWEVGQYRLNKAKQCQAYERDAVLQQGLLFGLSESNSVAPVKILRSSLFKPVKKGRRALLTREVVAKWDGGEMTFSGGQPDQADFTVLLKLMELLSDYSKSGNVNSVVDQNGRIEYSRIIIVRNAFLKELGRASGGSNYKWLDDALFRLSGRLELVEYGIGKVSGGILGKTYLDENNGCYVVDINKDFIKLFQNNTFSYIDMDARKLLKKPFELWLQGFVSTHSGWSEYSAQTFHELSKSDYDRVRDFMRLSLTPAFQHLLEIGVIEKFIEPKKTWMYKWYR